MKKILTVLITVLALLVLASCTNDIKDPIDDKTETWESIFQQYWNTMSQEYAHFSEEENLDWDAVYDEYLPLFQALDYTKQEDSMTAFKYFKAICWQLKDYHYALKVSDAFGTYIQISPSGLQKMKAVHPDWDINDYPDVMNIYVDATTNLLTMKMTSVNRGLDDPYLKVASGSKPTDAETAEVRKYLYTTEGYAEVSQLGDEFHGGTAAFTKSVGYTISKYKADSTTALKEEEKAWNTVVDTLGLDGFTYFYGLTTEGFFYYYFSKFPMPYCLEDLLYQENLTGTERSKLSSEGLEMVHDILWNQNLSTSIDLSSKRAEIKGIYDLLKNLKSIGSSGTCTFDGYTKDTVLGVIMDVRGNGGGVADFLFRVMGSFFCQPTKVGSVRYRDGYGRYNYTPWSDYYLESSYCNEMAEQNYSSPFIMLTNGSSVSCSEISCIIAKLLPNCKVVGGQTYGGTCALTDRTIFHSGPFQSSSLYIYTTTYQAVDSNGVNLESVGITPDVPVKYTTETTDERFTAAIDTLKKMLSGGTV